MAGLGAERWMSQKAPRAKPIVKRNQHHTLFGQARAVEQINVAKPASVSTAVEPNHYGQWFCVITRRPDVQVQTIFAARKLTSTPDKGITTVLLPAGGRKACSVTHSLPVVWCLGRFEAQFAHRWAGVGNAFKDPDVLFGIGPIAL